MYSRVTLTENHPTSVDIAEQYDVSVKSMILYYSKVNPGFFNSIQIFYRRRSGKRERGQA